MDEENRDSPFIEELGGADVPVQLSLDPNDPPEGEVLPAATGPDTEPAPETEPKPESDPESAAEPEPEPTIRLESEIRYLIERADAAEAELAALQQKIWRLAMLGLLVIAVFVFFLVQLKLTNARLDTGLKSVLARIGNVNPAKSGGLSGPAWHSSAVYFVTWNQGEDPVRLIKQTDGFCFLTKVTGHFQGDGESVRLWVDSDGYWYLGGDSQQAGVSAQCAVLRY